jgi:AraC-like DNA-binding protein
VNGNLLTMKEWQNVATQADFNSVKMATLCSISERQLQRLFKKHLHCTPSRWLRDLQCQLAKQLIIQGHSNKVIAAELRFSSESHFCREFKKAFGTSPQSFAPTQLDDSISRPAHTISKQSWVALQKTAQPQA